MIKVKGICWWNINNDHGGNWNPWPWKISNLMMSSNVSALCNYTQKPKTLEKSEREPHLLAQNHSFHSRVSSNVSFPWNTRKNQLKFVIDGFLKERWDQTMHALLLLASSRLFSYWSVLGFWCWMHTSSPMLTLINLWPTPRSCLWLVVLTKAPGGTLYCTSIGWDARRCMQQTIARRCWRQIQAKKWRCWVLRAHWWLF